MSPERLQQPPPPPPRFKIKKNLDPVRGQRADIKTRSTFKIRIPFGILTKGETITRVNGNVSFTAGKRLQNF